MAKEDSDIGIVSSSSSVNFENYSQLFDAFKRLMKGLNNWLENKVKTLQEELNNFKTDFENIEIIYKNSSSKCADLKDFENCDSLQKKVHYLLKTMDKFSRG